MPKAVIAPIAHPQHVLAVQKSWMALFVRTIGIDRAKMKIGMENLAHNFNRLVW